MNIEKLMEMYIDYNIYAGGPNLESDLAKSMPRTVPDPRRAEMLAEQTF